MLLPRQTILATTCWTPGVNRVKMEKQGSRGSKLLSSLNISTVIYYPQQILLEQFAGISWLVLRPQMETKHLALHWEYARCHTRGIVFPPIIAGDWKPSFVQIFLSGTTCPSRSASRVIPEMAKAKAKTVTRISEKHSKTSGSCQCKDLNTSLPKRNCIF